MPKNIEPFTAAELDDEKIRTLGLKATEVEWMRAFNPEKYTPKAHFIIHLSVPEVGRFESSRMTPNHLLSALLRQERKLVADVLQIPEKTIRFIRRQIEINLLQAEIDENVVDVVLSEELKQVLDFAAQESARLGKKKINIGHLLLGLMQDDQSFFASQLVSCGLNLDVLREKANDYAARTDSELHDEVITDNPVDISFTGKIQGGSILSEVLARIIGSRR